MSRPPLDRLRAEIEALAADGGRYGLVCARTGERPVPVDGLAFDTRGRAERAAMLAERYRARLREFDPSLPYRDLVASERPATAVRPVDDPDPAVADSLLDDLHGDSERVRFCHDVLEAVFCTLRSRDRDDVTADVMDAYRAAAGDVADPDELCLLLLDRVASAMDDRLAPADRASVCAAAARRLPPAQPGHPYPLVAAFERLVTVDLLDEFSTSPWIVEEDARSCTVRLRGYALWPSDGRLPTLPIALDVLRRTPGHGLAIEPAQRVGDRTWVLRLSARPDETPAGLASVPVRS